MAGVRDESGDYDARERRAGPEEAIGTEPIVRRVSAAAGHEPDVLGREIRYGSECRSVVSGVMGIERVARDEMIERRAAQAEIVETDLDGRHRGSDRPQEHEAHAGPERSHRLLSAAHQASALEK